MIIYSFQKEIRKICYVHSIFIKLSLAPLTLLSSVSNMSLQPQRNSSSFSFQPAPLTPFKLVDLAITQITLCQQNVHTVLFSGTNSNNGKDTRSNGTGIMKMSENVQNNCYRDFARTHERVGSVEVKDDKDQRPQLRIYQTIFFDPKERAEKVMIQCNKISFSSKKSLFYHQSPISGMQSVNVSVRVC